MFQRSFLVVLTVFLLGSLAAASADAETITSSGSRITRSTEAVERYREGRAAFDAGDFERAIRLFVEADRTAPSAALSFNIARSYEKLGNNARALEHYRHYLRREPDGAGAKRAAERITVLEAALERRGVQQITITTTPPGATVELNQRTLGVTPWTGELTPGDHTLVFTHAGYARTVRVINVSPERALYVEVALAPAGGAATMVAARPSPARPASFKERAGPWPFVTLGASAAAFGVAGAYELERSDAAAAARVSRTQLEYAAHRDEAESRQKTARVFVGVGAGLAVLGGVLLGVALLDDEAPSERDQAANARVSFDCGTKTCTAYFLERF